MPKDFYSDDHTIQTGAPGSGNGDFVIKTEGDCLINTTENFSTTSYQVELFGSDEAKLRSDGEAILYGESSAILQSGDGGILQLADEASLNKRLVISSGGTSITGPTEVIGNVEIDGNVSITGEISQASGWTRSGNIDITTSLGGDISLTAEGYFLPLGYGNINLTAANINFNSNNLDLTIGEDIIITGGDDITITAGTSDNGLLTIQAGSGANDPSITLTENSSLIELTGQDCNIEVTDDISLTCDNLNVTGKLILSGDENTSYVTTITNISNNSNADILKLNFENISSPSGSNNWVRFATGGSDSKGSIQGAAASSNYYAFYVPLNPDPGDHAKNGAGDPFLTLSGYAQFVSGNADFGEWIPLGEESEWGLTEENRKDFLKSSIFPVEEGVILYVRDSKAWKQGPGRGMAVTHRSIVIGNQNYRENGKLGVILSFTGQVPVFVEGPVEDGDLLVPIERTNHCRAIHPDQISFKDYQKAIGTAWGKKLTSEVERINCAIGLK